MAGFLGARISSIEHGSSCDNIWHPIRLSNIQLTTLPTIYLLMLQTSQDHVITQLRGYFCQMSHISWVFPQRLASGGKGDFVTIGYCVPDCFLEIFVAQYKAVKEGGKSRDRRLPSSPLTRETLISEYSGAAKELTTNLTELSCDLLGNPRESSAM